ncbi:Cyclin-D4-2 [Hirschfeldia incana]|nr:Cyclin-D4-2 [Hirschfeldia incana]
MAENLELSLLCTETINVGDDNMIVGREISNFHMGFPLESEEMVREMMEKEKQHFPSDDYIRRLRSGDMDFNARRRKALNWIIKACEVLQFGPLCMCLSVNYFDRFLSVHDLPNGEPWTMQLLAVACLSLAAKLDETYVPMLLTDLQVGHPQFLFVAKSIQRMELLVVNRLKGRLRAITPYSYISYFLRKLSNSDQEPSNTLISRSLKLIASKIKGIDFLEFRPSEVAAAVALYVSGELYTVHFDNSCFFPLFSPLQKERVKKIGQMIESGGSGLCSQTPSGVLEVSASCFSFKTHGSSSHIDLS